MIRYFKLEQGRVVEVTDGSPAPVLLCQDPGDTDRATLVSQPLR